MKFETQLGLLDRAYDMYAQGKSITAKQMARPIFEEMNRELYAATRKMSLPGLGYRRHYLSVDDYLTVLHAQGFSGTSLDSVTAISWNKHFNDDDSHTLVGSLVRLGKQYDIYDHRADARAIRALALLTAIIANRLGRAGANRLVISVPSSMKSTNTLPREITELIASTSRRNVLAVPNALERRRDIGQMKNINEVSEKLRLVKGSMVADAELVQGHQVVLIDDLLGCGGTLRESARALKAAGAAEVHALAMAKTRSFAKETMCKA